MSSGPPVSARRAVRLAAVVLLLAAGGVIALIAAGAFDPLPGAPPAHTAAPGPVSLSSRGEVLYPQPLPFDTLPEHYWLRLNAAYSAGERDSGYGLALGDTEQGLTVAVSPLGYAAVWAKHGETTAELLPWQTWPHVRTGDAANEIWLEVRDHGGQAEVAAWVNRQLLWQGKMPTPAGGAALWLAGFSGPVTVDFRALDWWAEQSSTDEHGSNE